MAGLECLIVNQQLCLCVCVGICSQRFGSTRTLSTCISLSEVLFQSFPVIGLVSSLKSASSTFIGVIFIFASSLSQSSVKHTGTELDKPNPFNI